MIRKLVLIGMILGLTNGAYAKAPKSVIYVDGDIVDSNIIVDINSGHYIHRSGGPMEFKELQSVWYSTPEEAKEAAQKVLAYFKTAKVPVTRITYTNDEASFNNLSHAPYEACYYRSYNSGASRLNKCVGHNSSESAEGYTKFYIHEYYEDDGTAAFIFGNPHITRYGFALTYIAPKNFCVREQKQSNQNYQEAAANETLLADAIKQNGGTVLALQTNPESEQRWDVEILDENSHKRSVIPSEYLLQSKVIELKDILLRAGFLESDIYITPRPVYNFITFLEPRRGRHCEDGVN